MSRTYRLEREQFVALPLEEVFAFFADAANLDRLTPPWLHFQILTRTPLEMDVGTRIEYQLRLRGFPIRWRTEITVWEPPHRFVDLQREGPYREWEHTHEFRALAGGTVVRDVVDYAVPGPGLVQRLFVGPELERIFDYRHRQLDAWVLETLRERREEYSHLEGSPPTSRTGVTDAEQ